MGVFPEPRRQSRVTTGMTLRSSVLAGALFLAVIAGAAPAQATSVRIVYTETDDRIDVYTEYTLTITANRGESNRVVLRRVKPGVYVVEDRGSKRRMVAGEDCRRTARTRVVCRPRAALDFVDASLRDRDDQFVVRGALDLGVTVGGGTGRDRISSERALLDASGDDGDDRLVGGRRDDTLRGGSGDDTVIGGPGGDTLEGGRGRDRAFGRGGDDILSGADTNGSAADVLDGGAGRDRLTYDGRRGRVRIDLQRGRAGSRGTEDRVRGIEDATGGELTDVLLGDSRANALDGEDGADMVSGREGDDILIGGIVLGGDGNDQMSFGPAPGSNCGDGQDIVIAPDAATAIPRTCERLAVGAYDTTPFPARPVEMTADTLTFELTCPGPGECDPWRLRVEDAVTRAVLAEGVAPDAAQGDVVRVVVPRSGALAPGPVGRAQDVIVRVEGTAYATPTRITAWRISLDL